MIVVLAQEPDDFFEEQKAVDVGKLRIGIGKMLAQVAEVGGAEQGVADGVAEHIRVGMPGEAEWMFDLDAAEHQTTSGHERVNVISETDAQFELS